MAHRTSNLRDVARLAGVDVSTASRVLSGSATQRVSSETRSRILEVARALDYRPNTLARGLRTARTFALGIVVPQLDNPVFSSAIRGAEVAARGLGYSLIISHRDPGYPVEGEYRRLTTTHRVDGLLVASLDEDRDLIGALEETGVPFVLMNRRIESAPSVALDSRQAAHIGADYLLDLGHRRIAHLAGRLEGFNGQERLAGYRAALEARGLDPNAMPVEPAGYTAEGGRRAMRAILAKSGARPTAILAATVVSAAGALASLHDAELAVPGDMSIVAIHDAPIAAMVYPALTVVQTPTEEMGARAVELLVALIRGDAPGPVTLLTPTGLIVRQSTAPVSHRD
jgi:LacI family transcriptional regulator